jgi:DNA-directed RNA polymerase sigma subunit (sigma70/sigma32)
MGVSRERVRQIEQHALGERHDALAPAEALMAAAGEPPHG